MDYCSEDIKIEMDKALGMLAQERGKEEVDSLKPILYTNLDRGRIQGFLDGEIDGIYAYVWRVSKKYSQLSPFIQRLQRDKSSDIWEPLLERMESWAYRYFVSKNFYRETAREIAKDCADNAAMSMMKAYFPYDTDFEPWAHVIVQNSCRKYIREATRKSAVPQQSLISLSDTLEIIEDSTFQDREYQANLRQVITEALTHLPPARRQVIEWVYFDGLEFSEIAARLGKSVSAVHSLHFNALYALRKILSQQGEILP